MSLHGEFYSAPVTPPDIDSVFLTSSSSFVAAVRQLFEEQFGGCMAVKS